MYQRRKKLVRRRPRRAEHPPEDVEQKPEPPDPVEPKALYTITLTDRQGRDCVIAPFDGGRPGRLRTMVNGVHKPGLRTQTKLMAWLREKLPRTSAKRVTEA